MEPTPKPFVYVPDGAKINLKNQPLEPPEVKYEKRRVEFPREEVKKQITKRDTP